jgi:hypothetical protein
MMGSIKKHLEDIEFLSRDGNNYETINKIAKHALEELEKNEKERIQEND